MTDNAHQFTSGESESFLNLNGVKHVKVPAYHPASNCLAESFVQNFKKSLAKKKAIGGMSLNHCIANFLLGYRNMPHATTKKTPAELFLNRQVCMYLSLLKPTVSHTFKLEQFQKLSTLKKEAQDVFCWTVSFGEEYGRGERWLDAVVRGFGSSNIHGEGKLNMCEEKCKSNIGYIGISEEKKETNKLGGRL